MSIPNKITKEQKAYIAGLLDADGSVGIDRSLSKSNAYKYNYRVRIIITNSNYDVICWLKDIVGVGCSHRTGRAYKANWSPVHRWQVVAESARLVLKEIEPYMIIKKDLAKMAINFPSKGRVGKMRTTEDYREQERLYWKFKELNQRGYQCTI